MRCSRSILLLLLSCPFLARADEVFLRNGRVLEGEVVRRTPGALHLELREGRFVIPASMVLRVEERSTPEEELAERRATVDPEDPRALEALAEWASTRRLGDEATNLRAMAQGARLERMVAAAQLEGSARAYVAAFGWARRNGLSEEVQRWLLDQARLHNDLDPAVHEAEATLAADRAAEARRQAERAELLRRPRYVDPGRRDQVAAAGEETAPARRTAPRRADRGQASARELRVQAILARLVAQSQNPTAHRPRVVLRVTSADDELTLDLLPVPEVRMPPRSAEADEPDGSERAP